MPAHIIRLSNHSRQAFLSRWGCYRGNDNGGALLWIGIFGFSVSRLKSCVTADVGSDVDVELSPQLICIVLPFIWGADFFLPPWWSRITSAVQLLCGFFSFLQLSVYHFIWVVEVTFLYSDKGTPVEMQLLVCGAITASVPFRFK